MCRFAWLILLLSVQGLAMAAQPKVPLKVLFVGNSLTYYNDLPQIVAAMYGAVEPGSSLQTEMLATGGATMADHLAEGRLARALATQKFDVVVLQDRGGFPVCFDDATACKTVVGNVCEAVRLVRSAKARPILYGTWQAQAPSQQRLTTATQEEALHCHVEVADVGAAMQRFVGSKKSDESPWLPDGHPALAGSITAAASLLDVILQHNLPGNMTIPSVCRQHWQGAYLTNTMLASQQIRPDKDCAPLSDSLVRTAVEAAKVAK